MDIIKKDIAASLRTAYLHGGDPLKDLLRFKLSGRKIIDFSLSLNPLGIPPVIKEHWHELMDAARDYPTVRGDGIARFYQDKLGMPPSGILAGNGSTEMIYLVPRLLRPRRVLIITPSFNDYRRASTFADAEIQDFPLSAENNFSIDFETLADACKGIDMVWLGNPNNPTATLSSRNSLLRLACRFPDKWFVVDEAFIQFLENWHDESLITTKKPHNIIVIHSLTKFYGLAGLRMGAVIGHEEIISKLERIKEPWTINGIADKAAALLTECDDFESESRLFIAGERERVLKKLRDATGIVPFPSSVNFILCQWLKTENLDDLIKHLLIHGFYVRDCRNFPGLENNYFRIGLRTPAENDQLMSIVSAYREG